MKIFGNMLFSIGAMKAGTSWLYEVLKHHPDLDTVPIKEIHYFWDAHGSFRLLTREQRIATAQLHINGLLPGCDPGRVPAMLSWFGDYLRDPVDDVWFANLFRSRGQKKYCAEFSNMYAVLPDAAWDHIRTLTENLKIIYTLRNPLQRIWSHAKFHAQIIGVFDELESWDVRQFESFLTESGMFEHGTYSKIISMLQDRFEPGEYMFCLYDEIREKPLACLRKIEKFLDIRRHSYHAGELGVVHNPSREKEMPPNFLLAVRGHIDRELDALRRLNFRFPASWLPSSGDAHGGSTADRSA